MATVDADGVHVESREGHARIRGGALEVIAGLNPLEVYGAERYTVRAVEDLVMQPNSGDIVLFGAFLVWAIVDYTSARRRDRAIATVYPPGTASRDAAAIVIGTVAWVVFGFWLHGPLIGVRPF